MSPASELADILTDDTVDFTQSSKGAFLNVQFSLWISTTQMFNADGSLLAFPDFFISRSYIRETTCILAN